VDIEDIGIDVSKYDYLILGSPIWYNTIVPIVKAFIEQFKGKRIKTIYFTTSDLPANYSLKFKEELEKLGYKVLLHFNVIRGKLRQEDKENS